MIHFNFPAVITQYIVAWHLLTAAFHCHRNAPFTSKILDFFYPSPASITRWAILLQVLYFPDPQESIMESIFNLVKHHNYMGLSYTVNTANFAASVGQHPKAKKLSASGGFAHLTPD